MTCHDVITIKHKAISDKYYDDIYDFNDPSGRAVSGVGLWPPTCWDCGFESRRGYRSLSFVSVVCCQVVVSVSV
jgi:predicted Zn-ribbon and HTH transcriptional regulator